MTVSCLRWTLRALPFSEKHASFLKLLEFPNSSVKSHVNLKFSWWFIAFHGVSTRNGSNACRTCVYGSICLLMMEFDISRWLLFVRQDLWREDPWGIVCWCWCWCCTDVDVVLPNCAIRGWYHTNFDLARIGGWYHANSHLTVIHGWVSRELLPNCDSADITRTSTWPFSGLDLDSMFILVDGSWSCGFPLLPLVWPSWWEEQMLYVKCILNTGWILHDVCYRL